MPIVEELKDRGGYTVHASMPRRSSDVQQTILSQVCSELDVVFVAADSEPDRIKKIIREAYDVIIVGNVGQLKQIVLPDALAVMVYHGIGLKQSYYRDIDDRINIRVVESVERLHELKEQGHTNLVLTGFTKLDKLYTIPENEPEQLKQKLNLNRNKKTILYAPSFYPTLLS